MVTNRMKRKFLIIVAAHVGIVGCGGGVSGTGGLAGDLDHQQKIADLPDARKGELCNEVAQRATDNLRAETTGPALKAYKYLRETYTDYQANVDASEDFEKHYVANNRFFATTAATIEAECNEKFQSALARQSAEGLCVDSSKPAPEIGYTPSSEALAQTGDIGPCGLSNPLIADIGLTVGDYTRCVEAYMSKRAFSPSTYIKCNEAYDLIKDGKLSELVVQPAQDSSTSEYQAVEAACKPFTSQNDYGKGLSSNPLACIANKGDQPFNFTIY